MDNVSIGEVIALSKVFGGGGGSSGGGMLVAHMSYNEQLDNDYTDKTWKEIHESPFAVITQGIGPDGNGNGRMYVASTLANNNAYYATCITAIGGSVDVVNLAADSENGYLTWAD